MLTTINFLDQYSNYYLQRNQQMLFHLLLEIEQAVRDFPRYHKYTLGSELRCQAMMICRCLVRALNADKAERLPYVRRLTEAVDDIKLQIQLGKELHAFRDFRQFQTVSEQAVCIGRQSGRWRATLRPAATSRKT